MSGLQLRRIPTKDLVGNRANVREQLDGIDELAASIRAQGVMQPLIVNDRAGTLVVTDGHRRLEAAKRAGVPTLVCIVSTDADDKSVITQMLAASMHKELKPIEQARGFDRLRKEGVLVADIGRATGYGVQFIRNRLLLLELPAEAQDMVEDGALNLGQATELAKMAKARKSGSVATAVNKSRHFTREHRLASQVDEECASHPTHWDARQLVGGVGCGPCWETVIRRDELRLSGEQKAGSL